MSGTDDEETAWDPERDALLKPAFRADLVFWVQTEPRIALRVLRLIEDVLRDPRRGLGKPEALRYSRRGVWSRRITQEHRFIYQLSEQGPLFMHARHHYG
ncbi:MAG TPA: Txe/YoeB family addiction module toxin [Longimicrobium sp.]|jgi:toxin YoeB|uniref:Txe/YoeB family addiction module toxin n=1 Tax=Longimicrobium sp. TaxID=2029185 RepID=UPI002ED97702